MEGPGNNRFRISDYGDSADLVDPVIGVAMFESVVLELEPGPRAPEPELAL